MMSVFWLLILLIGRNYDDDVGGRVSLLGRGGGDLRGREALTLAWEHRGAGKLGSVDTASAVELETKVHEDFTITMKAPTTTKLQLVMIFVLLTPVSVSVS